MTSPRQIETLSAEVDALLAKLSAAQAVVDALSRDVERAARRCDWLADWNRLSAQQQLALKRTSVGYRWRTNAATVESLERLGLIERIDSGVGGGWRATEAGARLADAARTPIPGP